MKRYFKMQIAIVMEASDDNCSASIGTGPFLSSSRGEYSSPKKSSTLLARQSTKDHVLSKKAVSGAMRVHSAKRRRHRVVHRARHNGASSAIHADATSETSSTGSTEREAHAM